MLKTDYVSILKIAIPMMVGMFIQSVVMITDSAILSNYSIDSYNAVGNAGLIYVTLFMGMNGLGDAAQITMSNKLGEKNASVLNRIIPTSVISNFLLAILFFFFIQFFAEPMLNSYSRNLTLVQEQNAFLTYRSFGFFFVMISLTLNGYFLAIGKTTIILLGAILLAITNIGFDFLLVFGVKGFIPEMGTEGAAIASIIGEATSMIFLIIVFFTHNKRKELGILKLALPKKEYIKNLWSIGIPLVLQGFLALATWTIFFTWIEQRGDYELTVSQNIRNIYMLAFIPIFGFNSTTKTYVSNLMGSKDYDEIKIVIKKIILLSIIALITTFHGAIFYPEEVVSLVNENEVYLSESARILSMIFLSLLVFAIISPVSNAISATGNTKASLFIEILSIIIYLVVSYLFLKVLELEIFYVWFVEYIYFGVIGIAALAYFKFFDWKKKRIK